MIKINAKYTPGPWKLFNEKGDIVSTETGDLIVRWDAYHTEEHQLADSKLMAIAPEMVDLLRETLVVDALSVDERRALFVKIIKVLNKGGIVVGGE